VGPELLKNLKVLIIIPRTEIDIKLNLRILASYCIESSATPVSP
jgi:hypothetical protein